MQTDQPKAFLLRHTGGEVETREEATRSNKSHNIQGESQGWWVGDGAW